MNKQELVKILADAADLNRTKAEAVLNALVTTVHDAVAAGDEVTIADLGKFSAEDRAARKGRNPSTGAEIDIPAKRVPKFSAAKALKDAVAG